MGKIQSSLAVFDYANHKLCDLYDSQNDIPGQAYSIKYSTNMKDGIKQLTFSIPFMIETEKNFRWDYLKSEYLIRLTHGNIKEWFIATKPAKTKNNSGIVGNVTCSGKETILKTKNIYKEYDDENGIGTLDELVDDILLGTGWHRGYTDPMLEEDGVTEKIRSLSTNGKKGALDLIATVCNLFKCYPVYKTDTNIVEFYSYNNRDQVIEGRIGKNMDSLTVTPDSSDIITRLYVEGEYGDNGYVGIDSVNPTGLNYILNFDYYRKLGLLTADHEAALSRYLTDISRIKRQIEAKQSEIISVEDQLNNLIGQCAVSVYYKTSGFVAPVYTYGDPTTSQQILSIGDKVLILQNNGQYRYATITSTAQELVGAGDYGIVKFGSPSAGLFGAAELGVEAKEKQIEALQRKISQTTKADKIAEYRREISELESGIQTLYVGTEDSDGLYEMADSMFRAGGEISVLSGYISEYDVLLVQQDEIEATFISVMGDLLRDGYWQNTNYIPGQEQHLYNDATVNLEQMSRPTIGYKFGYVRTNTEEDIDIQDIKLNAIFRIDDDELETDEMLFVTKITIGIDDESNGSIEISNKDITMSANDLGSVLSRMSQLADLIDQKNTLYDRAAAISKNKTFYTDRLNGQINVLTNQILSTVSNWYTDEQGNIMFISADGGSAMMLSGAGFMISNQKDENNQWVWRTFGTGEGFTADEIVAGFISAERIEAGSIATSKLQPDVGNTLVITGNPAITEIYNSLAPTFDEETNYSEGEYVNYNGKLYMFINDHPAGPWNSQDVSSTSVTSVIELLPDRIIQYIGEQGYSRTYIQYTDPTLDPDKNVMVGDIWIFPETIWSQVKELTWAGVKNNGGQNRAWGYYKAVQTFYWDGNKWNLISDRGEVQDAYTRITQTQHMILEEAERADALFIAKTTQLQTADSIVSEAVRQSSESIAGGYIAKTSAYQDADSIVTEAVRQSSASAANGYIAKTSTLQTADQIVTEAVRQSSASAANGYIAKTSTYQDASSIVTAAQTYTNNTLQSYSTTTQTSTMISNYVTNNAYKIQSGIAINASGVEITGSKYVQIKSGATFYVSSDYFELNSTNRILEMKVVNDTTYAATGVQINSRGIDINRYQDITSSGTWTKNLTLEICTDNARDSIFNDEEMTYGYTMYMWVGSNAVVESHTVQSYLNIQLGRVGTANFSSNCYPQIFTFCDTSQRFKYNETSDTFTEVTYSSATDADGLIAYIGPQKKKHAWSAGKADRPFYAGYFRTLYTSNGRVYSYSSREYKKDIQALQEVGEIIDQLKPVSFVYKKWSSDLQLGLIYEDTLKVLPTICSESQGMKSINYLGLVPVLLKELQTLRKRVKELEEKLK